MRTATTLSPRERETLALADAGLRNVDIARRLGTTEGTVKQQLRVAFLKVGRRSGRASGRPKIKKF
jgi:DNA-binding NarL/FixJ family response regulator